MRNLRHPFTIPKGSEPQHLEVLLLLSPRWVVPGTISLSFLQARVSLYPLKCQSTWDKSSQWFSQSLSPGERPLAWGKDSPWRCEVVKCCSPLTILQNMLSSLASLTSPPLGWRWESMHAGPAGSPLSYLAQHRYLGPPFRDPFTFFYGPLGSLQKFLNTRKGQF